MPALPARPEFVWCVGVESAPRHLTWIKVLASNTELTELVSSPKLDFLDERSRTGASSCPCHSMPSCGSCVHVRPCGGPALSPVLGSDAALPRRRCRKRAPGKQISTGQGRGQPLGRLPAACCFSRQLARLAVRAFPAAVAVAFDACMELRFQNRVRKLLSQIIEPTSIRIHVHVYTYLARSS